MDKGHQSCYTYQCSFSTWTEGTESGFSILRGCPFIQSFTMKSSSQKWREHSLLRIGSRCLWFSGIPQNSAHWFLSFTHSGKLKCRKKIVLPIVWKILIMCRALQALVMRSEKGYTKSAIFEVQIWWFLYGGVSDKHFELKIASKDELEQKLWLFEVAMPKTLKVQKMT